MQTSLRRLSDDQLMQRLQAAARDACRSTAVLVAHLTEVERRKLHRDEGYSSLFEYCVRVLKLSEQAAYARIHAARLSLRYPVLLDKLRSGQLHLTAINRLGRKLTDDNHVELIEAACGRSKAELERLLAERFPANDVPTVVRKLPGPKRDAARSAPTLKLGLASTPTPAQQAPAPARRPTPIHFEDRSRARKSRPGRVSRRRWSARTARGRADKP